jgi:hypothetical protein
MCGLKIGKRFTKSKNLVRYEIKLDDAWIAEFLFVTKAARLEISSRNGMT